MKLITTKTETYRPRPFPCAEILERKKHYLFGVIILNRFTKFLLLLTLFTLGFSIRKCTAQPRNLQVKVIEAKYLNKRKAELKCISMQGDTVYLRYGSLSSVRGITPGTWLSVQGDLADKKGKWYCRKIKINQ